MIIDIPGHKPFDIRHIVCDFNGTVAVDGVLLPGVAERFAALSQQGLSVSVITADTHGNVRDQLKDVTCDIHILTTKRHDIEKKQFVSKLGAQHVAAFGNGYNDHKMIKAARLGVAVCQSEGLAGVTAHNADVVVTSIHDGLDLILKPSRLIASLRY